MKKPLLFNFIFFIICIFSVILCSCASGAISAEEFYSIGMAYFDLGRFEEAERWLNRARQSNRTMTASTYNLGRLAFERQRYEEAARHFESILRRDPDNVLALRAAAYTRIMLLDYDKAQIHYSRLLSLVPESADDGYNHALVLFVMNRFSDAEEVLKRYPVSLRENRDTMLLFARIQAAQNNVEAIESFSSWLNNFSDPKVRYEYAQALEVHQFFARALEEYRKAFSDTAETSQDPKRSDIRFAIARTLLIADGSSREGITELQNAVDEGFNDIEAIESLSLSVHAVNRDAIRNIINTLRLSLETDS